MACACSVDWFDARATCWSVARLFRDRTRSAKRLARQIQASTAPRASRQTQAEQPAVYRRLLAVARASLNQARQVATQLETQARVAGQRLPC
jgi:hypothetical protein